MIVLHDAEDRVIVFYLSGKKHRNVPDGQTNRQNRRSYYSALHCEHGGRAVKTGL